MRVQNGVDGDLVSVVGKSFGVFGLVSPFIGVTEIGIVVDHHHKSPVVVEDALAFGDESVPFPRNAAVEDVRKAGNLHDFVDVEKLMEDGVVLRDILDLRIWKDLSNLL